MKCEKCPFIDQDVVCYGEIGDNYHICSQLEHNENALEFIKSNTLNPSLMDKAQTLVKSTIKHIIDKGKLVSEEDKEKRLSICKVCEFYNEERVVCKACGCYLEIKTSWASESCPLDPPKWYKIKKAPSGAVAGDCGCSGSVPKNPI